MAITFQKAEIVRQRDPGTGKLTWSINLTTTDDKGGIICTTVAERDDMRTILRDALILERQGVRVARGGLAHVESGGARA